MAMSVLVTLRVGHLLLLKQLKLLILAPVVSTKNVPELGTLEICRDQLMHYVAIALLRASWTFWTFWGHPLHTLGVAQMVVAIQGIQGGDIIVFSAAPRNCGLMIVR
jgi:hypothetical protein